MGSADDVAVQFLPQNPCVTLLHTRRHRQADAGKGLMAIQSAQHEMLPIEVETLRGELRLAETDLRLVLIDDTLPFRQPDLNLIKLRTLDTPKVDVANASQRQVIMLLFVRRDFAGFRGDYPIAVQQ